MKLAEIFRNPVAETATKLAAVATLGVSLTGCAGMQLNLPETNVGGIRIGTIFNQTTDRAVNDMAKGAAQTIKNGVLFTTCKDQNGSVIGVVQGDPSQCDEQVRLHQQQQQQQQRMAPVGRLPER